MIYALIALGPLLLIAVSVAILMVLSNRAASRGQSVLLKIGRALAIIALLIGLFAAVGVMSNVLAIFLWIVTAIVILGTIMRFFAAERQSLLWVLAVAAEREIPLDLAARAFAEERHDRVGLRAQLLADYLEAGVPLALALQRSGHAVSSTVLLAADLGQETGNLGTALRQATAQDGSGEAVLRSMLSRAFYITFLIFVSCLVLAWLMIRIIPVLSSMFDSFEFELPAATELLISISETVAQGWLVTVPLLALWLVGLILLALSYLGMPPRNLPLLNRLWWSADCALVLRWLAMSVRQGRPLTDVIRDLAVRFPQAAIRRRLEQASRQIDRGGDWCDSLRQVRLIRSSEHVLFQSAQRAGNLAWAFDEMAESGLRRSHYRLRAWLNIIFPIVVILMGGAVLFIALGVMGPLISFVGGLA